MTMAKAAEASVSAGTNLILNEAQLMNANVVGHLTCK